MKRLVVFFLFVWSTVVAVAQYRYEVGGFGGGSWYVGDASDGKPFATPYAAYGGIFRYNLNQRYVLKVTASKMTLAGSLKNAENTVPYIDPVNVQFKRDLMDLALLFEINFLPYRGKSGRKWSPFIEGGLGSCYYNRYKTAGDLNSRSGVFTFTIPFGLGFKYALSERWNVGLEWMGRKTFVDDLDVTGYGVLDDPYQIDGSTLINNDWYYFAGIFLTFNLSEKRWRCSGNN